MLNKKQIKCIEMMLDEKKQCEIADALGITQSTISHWKKLDEFDNALTEALRQSLKGIAPKALSTMVSLLSARSELVRFNAAKDLLDRAGFKPEDRVELGTDLDLNITVDYGDDGE